MNHINYEENRERNDEKVIEVANKFENVRELNLLDLKPKISVSEIKEKKKGSFVIDNSYYEDKELIDTIEDEKTHFDGTSIGNAYHRYMQFFDFNDCIYKCRKI